jgi:F-type H+-transporting ATPase subunit b
MTGGTRRWKFCLKGVRAGGVAGWLLGALLFGIPAMAAEHGAAVKGWEATDTYRIINFVVLAVVLYLLLRKPVSQALHGRIKGIKEELAELENRKREAEAKLSQYTEKLSLLDEEAKKIVDGYIEQGVEAKARIILEARASAEKLEADTKRRIEQAFARAREEVQGIIIGKAMEKAEVMIRGNISAADQERIVDDYLEKVATS